MEEGEWVPIQGGALIQGAGGANSRIYGMCVMLIIILDSLCIMLLIRHCPIAEECMWTVRIILRILFLG